MVSENTVADLEIVRGLLKRAKTKTFCGTRYDATRVATALSFLEDEISRANMRKVAEEQRRLRAIEEHLVVLEARLSALEAACDRGAEQ